MQRERERASEWEGDLELQLADGGEDGILLEVAQRVQHLCIIILYYNIL